MKEISLDKYIKLHAKNAKMFSPFPSELIHSKSDFKKLMETYKVIIIDFQQHDVVKQYYNNYYY